MHRNILSGKDKGQFPRGRPECSGRPRGGRFRDSADREDDGDEGGDADSDGSDDEDEDDDASDDSDENPDDDDGPEAGADAVAVDAQVSNPEATRFAAHVEQLDQLSEKGDADAKERLRRLLIEIDAGPERPIDVNSEEALRTAHQFARRLGRDDASTTDMLRYIERLRKISRSGRDDATDAFDALCDQIADMVKTEHPDAGDELEDRVDNIEHLAQEFSDLGAPELSEAVQDLATVLRGIALDDKVDGVLALGESVADPDLPNLVDGVRWLATHLEGIETEEDFDRVIDILRSVPGIEDGVDQEDLEEVEGQWEPEVASSE